MKARATKIMLYVGLMLLFDCALTPASGAGGAVPGTNGKIVFESTRTTQNAHTWVMNGDGSLPTILDPPTNKCDPATNEMCEPNARCRLNSWTFDCNSPANIDQDPEWSPDGSRIAFASDRYPPFPDGNREIYVMNADGSDVVKLTTGSAPAPHRSWMPSWSPDGTKMAFVSDEGGGVHIWVMNSNGSGRTQLTTVGLDTDPEWSPDGTQIVFGRGGDNGKIFMINADGTNEQQISGLGAQPAWSPDGSKVLYWGNEAELTTINPDGSGLVTHTSDPWGHFFPAWSPDGRKIAYSVAPSVDAIHVVDAVGGTDVNLTPGAAGLNLQPDWQPRPCTIVGTAGDDVLTGTPGDDVICALGGNDTVKASGGNDTVFGAEGNDKLTGGVGDDVLFGGPGNDRFLEEAVASGRDVFYGGAGTDKVDYSKRNANLAANINGLPGSGASGEGDAIATDVENLTGGAGDDSLTGSDLKNVLDGRSGTNTLIGGGGNDKLIGGVGIDSESGGPGKDTLVGGGGDDHLTGDAGRDKLTGGAGSDQLFGGDDNDTLNTQDGVGGNDTADGGNGTDTCLADPGDSVLNCEA